MLGERLKYGSYLVTAGNRTPDPSTNVTGSDTFTNYPTRLSNRDIMVPGWTAGQQIKVIEPALGACCITKFISLAQLAPGPV